MNRLKPTSIRLIIISFISFFCLQIDKKAMHKARMVQRVTNEVEIQCRLKHPSILEVKLAVVLHFPKFCH